MPFWSRYVTVAAPLPPFGLPGVRLGPVRGRMGAPAPSRPEVSMARVRPLRLVLLLGVAVATALGLAGPATAAPAATAPAPVAVRGIDLESATIPDLQRAMDAGRLSAVELTRFYLRRIATVDRKVNAVLAVNPDALRIAAASDARR